MLMIRPVRVEDVDALLALAQLTSYGLTTLPRDRALLERRVRDALRGFEKAAAEQPCHERYLFVMEDPATRAVVGTCGIMAKVGVDEPFYAYDVHTMLHESKMLGSRKEIQVLELVIEHDGPCEIGSLFLHPDYRGGGNGRLLSLARFLFMANHRRLCDPVVIAEMRGVSDEKGSTPFWDALGRHFFDLDYPTADYLSIVNKQFIAELMPRHPIYVPLLPPEAQAVIGQVHDQTAPALRMLIQEGFTYSGMVDIFEAGPILRCDRDQIRTIRESRTSIVQEIIDEPAARPTHVISNTHGDFRACMTVPDLLAEGGVRLGRDTAAALQVTRGDTVRHATLHAAAPAKDPA